MQSGRGKSSAMPANPAIEKSRGTVQKYWNAVSPGRVCVSSATNPASRLPVSVLVAETIREKYWCAPERVCGVQFRSRKIDAVTKKKAYVSP